MSDGPKVVIAKLDRYGKRTATHAFRPGDPRTLCGILAETEGFRVKPPRYGPPNCERCQARVPRQPKATLEEDWKRAIKEGIV